MHSQTAYLNGFTKRKEIDINMKSLRNNLEKIRGVNKSSIQLENKVSINKNKTKYINDRRADQIDRDNSILARKIKEIIYSRDKEKYHTSPNKYSKSLNEPAKKSVQKKIECENSKFVERLSIKKSSYPTKQMIKQWKQSQYFVRQRSRLDFYIGDNPSAFSSRLRASPLGSGNSSPLGSSTPFEKSQEREKNTSNPEEQNQIDQAQKGAAPKRRLGNNTKPPKNILLQELKKTSKNKDIVDDGSSTIKKSQRSTEKDKLTSVSIKESRKKMLEPIPDTIVKAKVQNSKTSPRKKGYLPLKIEKASIGNVSKLQQKFQVSQAQEKDEKSNQSQNRQKSKESNEINEKVKSQQQQQVLQKQEDKVIQKQEQYQEKDEDFQCQKEQNNQKVENSQIFVAKGKLEQSIIPVQEDKENKESSLKVDEKDVKQQNNNKVQPQQYQPKQPSKEIAEIAINNDNNQSNHVEQKSQQKKDKKNQQEVEAVKDQQNIQHQQQPAAVVQQQIKKPENQKSQ